MLFFILFSRTRSHVIVKGLGQVGGSGSQRDPQVLRARVSSVLARVGVRSPINVVNVVAYPASVYGVELDSAVTAASLIREFSKYTRRRDPIQRPSELDKISLYHSVTTGTRIRVSLLRVCSI